jgi:ectoine hydroxylase-related dioxygenase (phytanoyl-CoA dioxygenase family)
LRAASNFERNGFDIVPESFPAADIDALVDGLAAHPVARSRAGIRHAMQNPAVAELARDSRLCGFASSLLGGQALPYRATLFDKSPDSNWLVVWHQDTALPRREHDPSAGWGPWSRKEGVHYAHAPASALREVLALRLHLDDSTLENGPLRVLPGTHRLGVFGDDELHVLSEQVQPVDCLTPKGGVVAIRPLLVHASSKSKSELRRRVLHIEYTSAEAFEHLQLAVA